MVEEIGCLAKESRLTSENVADVYKRLIPNGANRKIGHLTCDLLLLTKTPVTNQSDHLRRWQAERDALRHRYLSGLPAIRPDAMPSDETGMHGKEKVWSLAAPTLPC
jgi:hypothetical protein